MYRDDYLLRGEAWDGIFSVEIWLKMSFPPSLLQLGSTEFFFPYTKDFVSTILIEHPRLHRGAFQSYASIATRLYYRKIIFGGTLYGENFIYSPKILCLFLTMGAFLPTNF